MYWIRMLYCNAIMACLQISLYHDRLRQVWLGMEQQDCLLALNVHYFVLLL
jgi:hypothetical protein